MRITPSEMQLICTLTMPCCIRTTALTTRPLEIQKALLIPMDHITITTPRIKCKGPSLTLLTRIRFIRYPKKSITQARYFTVHASKIREVKTPTLMMQRLELLPIRFRRRLIEPILSLNKPMEFINMRSSNKDLYS